MPTLRCLQSIPFRLPVGVRRLSSGTKPIGFIGLGQMGSRMARNCIKAGHDLIVYDMNDAAADECLDAGAKALAASVAEMGSQCGTIVTMLPAAQQVEEVYLDPTSGLFSNCEPGTLLIDCSTTGPSVAERVSNIATEHKMDMVDAPVSGGVGGAEAATLSFMVGGSKEAFGRAKTILSHMGKNIVHCGGPGKGQVAKVCNNLVLAITMIGLNEGYNLAITKGMDPAVISDIFNSSSAQCWSSGYVGIPGTKDKSTGFKVSLMSKDLGLAMETARDAGVVLPLGERAFGLYDLLAGSDLQDKDFSVVFEYLKEMNRKD